MKDLKAVNFVEIVKDYADMEIPEKGGNFECPLHDDGSKDSMKYYPETNTLHCFGPCSKTYSPIGFVAAYKGISNKDAGTEISRKYGLQNISGEELLKGANIELLRRFVEGGTENLSKEHVEKLMERGLTDEWVQKVSYGYYSEELIEESKLSEVELLEIGILSRASNGEFSTSFAKKIIIPLYKDNQLLTVLAWNYLDTENEPKYSLPSGTERPVVGDLKSGAVVVEGYFDMVSMQMSSYDAMTTLGASVTKSQLLELKKYKNLKIMFDGDRAGYEGAEKIARDLYPNARVANLPADEDPNSLYLEKKNVKFHAYAEKTIAEVTDFLEYELKKAEILGNPREAAKHIGEYVIPLISRLGELEQETVVTEIASKKATFGITKGALKKEVKKHKDDNTVEEVKEGSKATRIYEELAGEVELLNDESNGVMVRFSLGNKTETVGVTSDIFKRFVRIKAKEKLGSIPSTDFVNAVIATFESEGYFEGEKTKLENRIAANGDNIYYDMADDANSVVEICPNAWDVIKTSKFLFNREQHQKPQVIPNRNGDINLIFKLFKNMAAAQMLMLKVLLVCAFIPNIPKPILYIIAEKGSGKSKLTKAIRQLIDPSKIDSLKVPKIEDRVVEQLKHHFVGVFDNVNELHDWFIRLCCTAVTGESDERRALFTNEGTVIFSFKRFLIINAINRLGINFPDFQERLYILKLNRISEDERMEESEFDRIFIDIKPQVLGGIFNALSIAMAIKPTLKFDKLPRMADFAAYGSAVAIALGYTQEEFLSAYSESSQEANEELISDNPIAFVISELMSTRDYWKGKASELLEAIEDVAVDNRIDTKDKLWPKSPAALSMRLNSVLANLRDIGLEVTRAKETGSNASRYIEIKRTGKGEVQRNTDTNIEDNTKSYTTSGSI